MIGNFDDFFSCLRLIARKLAVLFGFNHGVRPFYAACHFDEVRREPPFCFLSAHNSIFYTKIDDLEVRRGDAGRILTWWQRPVVSKIAQDLVYRTMRSAPYCLIRMAIEMASKGGACFSVVNFQDLAYQAMHLAPYCLIRMASEMASKGGAWFYDITVAKQQCCGQLKIKPSYNIVRYYVFI